MVWKPGQSGNPKGRAASKPWTDAIARAIKRREEDDPLALEKLADKLLQRVAEGDVSAIKELGDRMEGKSKQPLEHDVGEGLEDWLDRLGKAGASETSAD
jgi:hypothetical protein